MIGSKTDLRKSMRQVLVGLSRAEMLAKSECLSSDLCGFIKSKDFNDDCFLGGFAPLSDEVVWFLKLGEYENQFAFPGIESSLPNSREMSFYQTRYEELEERDDFGVPILVPTANAKKVIPSALIIPGLAFSRNGERLGRGKGFYDQYLKDFSGIRIGVCFKEQLLEYIPVNDDDQSVDYIITDQEIISVDKRL